MRSVSLIVDSASSSGLQLALVYPNASCAGKEMYSAPTSVVGSHDVSLDPGFAVLHGGHLSILQGSDAVVSLYVWGYLAPNGDVPATTPVG